jgi:hypothetical protein
MTAKLSLLVAVDMDCAAILRPTGGPTSQHDQGLPRSRAAA